VVAPSICSRQTAVSVGHIVLRYLIHGIKMSFSCAFQIMIESDFDLVHLVISLKIAKYWFICVVDAWLKIDVFWFSNEICFELRLPEEG